MNGISNNHLIGIYAHVPFCAHLCPYCDFYKTAKFNKFQVDAYFDSLIMQGKELLPLIPLHYKKATLYLGGGTPSLFPASKYLPLIDLLKERFEFIEMTIETNPIKKGDKVLRQMKEYYDLGFRRVTVGAQSLCPDTLKFLGRLHSPEMVLESIDLLRRKVLFDQVQVDLIYGMKDYPKGLNSLEDQIKKMLSFGATGISSYALSVEEGTPMASLKIKPNCEDKMAEEYEEIYRTCLDLGMVQLETSNFSLKPHKSLHNNVYWYGLPYLGLGSGAHGLLPPDPIESPYGRRYKVEADFSLNFESKARTKEEYQQEMVFLLLRTPEGLPSSLCESFWGHDWKNKLLTHPQIKKCVEEGILYLSLDKGIQIEGLEKIRADFINEYLLSF